MCFLLFTIYLLFIKIFYSDLKLEKRMNRTNAFSICFVSSKHLFLFSFQINREQQREREKTRAYQERLRALCV